MQPEHVRWVGRAADVSVWRRHKTVTNTQQRVEPFTSDSRQVDSGIDETATRLSLVDVSDADANTVSKLQTEFKQLSYTVYEIFNVE